MTDEQSSDSKLVLRAEALVAKLSNEEPDWEALATRVNARLAATPGADETLLVAPLPEGEGESPLDRLVVPRQAPPATAASNTPREAVSLADLARASVARRGGREAQSVAKEALAVASQTRIQPERVGERVQAMPPAPPSQARPGRAQPSQAQPNRTQPSSRPAVDSRGPWIGVAIASIGLAAGFGLYFAGQRRTSEVIVQAPPVAAPATPAVIAKATPEPEHEATAEKAVEVAQVPQAQTVETLPVVPADASQRSALVRVPERAPEASTKIPAGTRPFGGGVAPERVVLDEDHPATPGKAAAAGTTKPADSAPLRPAELNPGVSSGDRPSAGAAQAAVGAVLGAARACIAGHSAPSSATLVFGSSGQVDRVSVSGPAAGTPAATCVEAALKKARVQPFAADSFSLGVTVRPP